MLVRTIAVNAKGCRLGDSHPNAKLTNDEVDTLLELHEQGWGYKKLAEAFDVSKSTVRSYCTGRMRCQTPTNWRKVYVKG
jgi:DNA-binding NarL/FixJ family response regulator